MSSESQKTVWYDPTEYDALSHGPPYLPPRISKAASLTENSKEAAFYDAPLMTNPTSTGPLTGLLGLLQALVMLHQVHHWNTKGSSYYGDHLLFERLYNDSVVLVDSLAEKALGVGDTNEISAKHQAQIIQGILASFGQGKSPDDMVAVSLRAETICLDALAKTLEALDLQGSLSPGLSNLLEGIADKHEEFVYLLRQRSDQSYSYDRR